MSGRLDELMSTGLGTLRPDMLYVWALTQLARGCVILGTAPHAPRLYQALAPYAGRAAVAAGAVMCSGSTDYYLAGLAALSGDTTAALQHYRTALSCHRRLGAQPMLARTLHEYARLLQLRGLPEERGAAAAALAEARAIATACGMTRLVPLLDQPGAPAPAALTLSREDETWIIGYAGARTRIPDNLGLRYLDLLVRNPGRELAAGELVRLAGAAGAVGTAGPAGAAGARVRADDLHDLSGGDAGDVLDQQARAAYRQRLADLDTELAEAEEWNDTERASRLRAEKDFLVRELAAATGLGGRARRLGSESERARINVTRAIRSAISRIRHRAPDAAAHLDECVRTGTRCAYSPPGGSPPGGRQTALWGYAHPVPLVDRAQPAAPGPSRRGRPARRRGGGRRGDAGRARPAAAGGRPARRGAAGSRLRRVDDRAGPAGRADPGHRPDRDRGAARGRWHWRPAGAGPGP
jgi:hypothetical protein